MKNEKIKILYFVDRMLKGGIQSLLVNWTSMLDKNIFSIDFLLLDDGNDYSLEDSLKKMGCNVYKLTGIWIKNPFNYIEEAKALNKFFKQHNDYKVIHFNSTSKNYMVLKYAKKYGIPVRIVHSHNIDFQTKNIIKKNVGNMLKLPMKKYATDYFACSKLAGEWLFGKKIVNSNKFTIIHNAIDYEQFKYNELIRKKIRKEFGFSNSDIVIGNVGRFATQKNHDFIIDIFNECYKINNNYKLLLIGIGELKNKIENKVYNLNLLGKVIFAGYRDDVNECMQAMDLFLMPSLYEGLPVVGVEAQASGLSCFVSKDVITNELKITDNVNYISLNNSATEWAKIICNHSIQRKNTKEELEREGYTIESVINKLSNFYIKQ